MYILFILPTAFLIICQLAHTQFPSKIHKPFFLSMFLFLRFHPIYMLTVLLPTLFTKSCCYCGDILSSSHGLSFATKFSSIIVCHVRQDLVQGKELLTKRLNSWRLTWAEKRSFLIFVPTPQFFSAAPPRFFRCHQKPQPNSSFEQFILILICHELFSCFCSHVPSAGPGEKKKERDVLMPKGLVINRLLTPPSTPLMSNILVLFK